MPSTAERRQDRIMIHVSRGGVGGRVEEAGGVADGETDGGVAETREVTGDAMFSASKRRTLPIRGGEGGRGKIERNKLNSRAGGEKRGLDEGELGRIRRGGEEGDG